MKLDLLWHMLEDLEDTKASQTSALLEFKNGDWYGPDPKELAWAKAISSKNCDHLISAVKCEIERREPGTFITH